MIRRLFLSQPGLTVFAVVLTVGGIVTTAVAVHYGLGEMEG